MLEFAVIMQSAMLAGTAAIGGLWPSDLCNDDASHIRSSVAIVLLPDCLPAAIWRRSAKGGDLMGWTTLAPA